MKISRLVKLGLATGCCLALAPIVNANSRHGNSSHGMGRQKTARAQHGRTSHGNSAFGHRQGSASTLTTGSQNNAYGQRTAARHRSQSSASHLKKSDGSGVSPTTATAPGNSAFGHEQGDAMTRTIGSQNNAYGKAQSEAARAKQDGNGDSATAAPAPSP